MDCEREGDLVNHSCHASCAGTRCLLFPSRDRYSYAGTSFSGRTNVPMLLLSMLHAHLNDSVIGDPRHVLFLLLLLPGLLHTLMHSAVPSSRRLLLPANDTIFLFRNQRRKGHDPFPFLSLSLSLCEPLEVHSPP